MYSGPIFIDSVNTITIKNGKKEFKYNVINIPNTKK